MKEIEVYDIEVEKTHTFFANNILVHNSAYLNLDLVPSKLYKLKTPQTPEEKVDIIDAFCVFLQKKIAESYENLFDRINGAENALEMKREAIGRGLFYQKKRYVMSVFDNEGVRFTHPKLKVMGLESVRSTTPKFCREKIEKAFENMFVMSQEDFAAFILDTEAEFNKLPIDAISAPTGVNGVRDYACYDAPGYKLGTPQHVKASILYNRLLKENELTGKYEEIQDGDKIRLVPLIVPNPVGNDVIAYKGSVLPPEFALDKYIDRRAQFEKKFLEPVKRVIAVAGLDTELRHSVNDFF